MRPLVAQAAALDQFITERGWSGCIIGGIANLRWGEPRLTRDVDATIVTGFGTEAPFIAELLNTFRPRIADAAAFAEVHRVVLLLSESGIPLDIALGGLPFEEEMVARATSAELAPGLFMRTVSAEDLVVLKAFADRDRDWIDIAGIAARQGRALDWHAIHQRLGPLVELKDAPEILTRLAAVRRREDDR
jgi:hypothetical protein